MKRNLLLASGILFAFYLIFRDQTPLEEKALMKEFDAPAAAPWKNPSKEKAMATEVIEEEPASGAEPAAQALPLPSFLPQARVIASVTGPEASDGRRVLVQTVETNMNDRYVRVERVIAPTLSGGTQVLEETAMVANQLLLVKPENMAAYDFLDMLGRAGAERVKELQGGGYLATFSADPSDPMALDTYKARVQELAGVEITVEPNYIRKLF